ncbi:MAG: molybdate transport system permease protein [Chthoniobacter sp.]|jgi:molybdate transport system permease protein|nr:molybdate transport system permease protein [Chthoniobacter sp.]
MSVETAQIVCFTLGAAAQSVVCILPPGLALAWLLARKRWRGKTLVETLVALPLIMPPVATGLILLRLFGRRGPLGAWLERAGVEIVFTWRAVVLAMAVMSFPLLVRSARSAFEGVDRDFEDAAHNLGSPPWRVFVAITLPLAMNGIVAGLVLAFARALGEFGATILVAGMIPGRTTTLPTAIYHSIQLGQDAEAFGLVGVSVVIAFTAIWLSEWLLRRAARR